MQRSTCKRRENVWVQQHNSENYAVLMWQCAAAKSGRPVAKKQEHRNFSLEKLLFLQIKAEESNFGCLRMGFNSPHTTFPIKHKPTDSRSFFCVRESTRALTTSHLCTLPLPQREGPGRNTLLQDKSCPLHLQLFHKMAWATTETALKPGHQLPNSTQQCGSIRSSCIAPVGLKFPSQIRQDTHMSD